MLTRCRYMQAKFEFEGALFEWGGRGILVKKYEHFYLHWKSLKPEKKIFLDFITFSIFGGNKKKKETKKFLNQKKISKLWKMD